MPNANSRAQSLTRDGTVWRGRTPSGTVTATDPLPVAQREKIMPSRAALYAAGWEVAYYRIDDAGRLLMGGRGPQRDARGRHDDAHLVRCARKLWPALEQIAFPWSWYSQVALTPDHLPYLAAPQPRVHIMFGYNGRGIALSIASGRMVAERILSRRHGRYRFAG